MNSFYHKSMVLNFWPNYKHYIRYIFITCVLIDIARTCMIDWCLTPTLTVFQLYHGVFTRTSSMSLCQYIWFFPNYDLKLKETGGSQACFNIHRIKAPENETQYRSIKNLIMLCFLLRNYTK